MRTTKGILFEHEKLLIAHYNIQYNVTDMLSMR